MDGELSLILVGFPGPISMKVLMLAPSGLADAMPPAERLLLGPTLCRAETRGLPAEEEETEEDLAESAESDLTVEEEEEDLCFFCLLLCSLSRSFSSLACFLSSSLSTADFLVLSLPRAPAPPPAPPFPRWCSRGEDGGGGTG